MQLLEEANSRQIVTVNTKIKCNEQEEKTRMIIAKLSEHLIRQRHMYHQFGKPNRHLEKCTNMSFQPT